MMKRIVWLTLPVAFVACGGAPKEPRSPAAEQSRSELARGAAQPDSADAAQESHPAPAAAAPAPTAAEKKPTDDAPNAIAQAISDFERATQLIRATKDGMLDCKNACRSLQSMERAASHLCELTRGTRDSFRCEDATLRVKDERRHIRSSCGACPMGQSLDPNAPLPPP